MTPSEAHDSAYPNDAGHDEMQLAVLRYLRASHKTLNVQKSYDKEPTIYNLASSQAERAFCCKSGRRFFADIAMEYTFTQPSVINRGSTATNSYTRLYVIVPVIHSAGAVLRQVAMLQHNMREWFAGQPRDWYGDCAVYTVARYDDPKAQLLADLGRNIVFTWDGLHLGLVEPA